jgi:hypothetical protein
VLKSITRRSAVLSSLTSAADVGDLAGIESGAASEAHDGSLADSAVAETAGPS